MSTSESSPDQYIVLLKDHVIMDDHIQQHNYEHNKDGNIEHNVIHVWKPEFANAYLGQFSPRVLNLLKNHQNVNYITPNYRDEEYAITEQEDAGWNLARIQQKDKITGKTASDLNYTYKYDSDHEAGAGVDIYIIDTGIYLEHEDFGGRAKWGTSTQKNTVDNPVTDTDVYHKKRPHGGHGTHVALKRARRA